MKIAAIAAVASFLAPTPVSAQSVEDFYKSHPVTIMVGFNVGNIYDTVMRTVARHIGKHIPGNPTVIPVNRPGAGSLAAANQVFNASPRDGTVIGVFNRISRSATFRSPVSSMRRGMLEGSRSAPSSFLARKPLVSPSLCTASCITGP